MARQRSTRSPDGRAKLERRRKFAVVGEDLQWCRSSCRHHIVEGSYLLVGAGPRSAGWSTPATGLNTDVHGADVAVAQWSGSPRRSETNDAVVWLEASIPPECTQGACSVPFTLDHSRPDTWSPWSRSAAPSSTPARWPSSRPPQCGLDAHGTRRPSNADDPSTARRSP